MTTAATSKTIVRSGACELRTKPPDRALPPRRHDEGAEDEEGEELEDRAHVLVEAPEHLRDLVARERERHAGDEGGDEAVPVREVGEPEGGEADPQRVEALVLSPDPASGPAAEEPAPGQRERRADQGAGDGLARQAGGRRGQALPGGDEGEEEEHERERDAVVQPRLDVERVADEARHALRGDEARGHDRVRRREDGAQEEGLRPGQLGKEGLPCEGEQHQHDRHRHDERSSRRLPVPAQELVLDEEARRRRA